MIDLIAMLCCVGGYGLLAFGLNKTGFAISFAGSAFWLLFALGVNSQALILQSVAFLSISAMGFVKANK